MVVCCVHCYTSKAGGRHQLPSRAENDIPRMSNITHTQHTVRTTRVLFSGLQTTFTRTQLSSMVNYTEGRTSHKLTMNPALWLTRLWLFAEMIFVTSGSHRTRSASEPTAMRPLRGYKLKILAALVLVTATNWFSSIFPVTYERVGPQGEMTVCLGCVCVHLSVLVCSAGTT